MISGSGWKWDGHLSSPEVDTARMFLRYCRTGAIAVAGHPTVWPSQIADRTIIGISRARREFNCLANSPSSTPRLSRQHLTAGTTSPTKEVARHSCSGSGSKVCDLVARLLLMFRSSDYDAQKPHKMWIGDMSLAAILYTLSHQRNRTTSPPPSERRYMW